MSTRFEFQVRSSSDFADPGALMRQASDTAQTYMWHAKKEIDEMFGVGYSAEHPELVAAFMQTAAMDMATAMIAKAIMYHGEQAQVGE